MRTHVLAAAAACALLGASTTSEARDSEFGYRDWGLKTNSEAGVSANIGSANISTKKISPRARASLDTNPRDTLSRGATTAHRGGGSFSGKASFYSHPGRVASGGRFNPHGLTTAHRTLPFGTKLRVSDPKSGRSVVVTVNDRGPFTGGRVLDLSLGAAKVLGMTGRGVMYVQAERL